MQTPTPEQLTEIARRTGLTAGAVLNAYAEPMKVRVGTHRVVSTEAPKVGAPLPPPRGRSK